jgi:hypothetical protein
MPATPPRHLPNNIRTDVARAARCNAVTGTGNS